jgi:ubiquinone/menaquinone biosynthesis C-methylase UbiE
MEPKSKMQHLNDHPYEDPDYWTRRATYEGVATSGWSPRLNNFYYSVKRHYVQKMLNGVPYGGRVLELGCGVGRIGKYIREARADLMLVGVDFSSGMLDAASQSKAYTALIKADISDIPIQSHSMDLVLAMDVLFHVVKSARKGKAWSEMGRVATTEKGIAAYHSAHELTSLVVIEKLIRLFWPKFWLGERLRDRVIIWLTVRSDRS